MRVPDVSSQPLADPGARAVLEKHFPGIGSGPFFGLANSFTPRAIAKLASRRFPLERVTTHRFGLKDVDLAIKSVGGNGVPDVIHASLMPWL